MAKKGPRCAVVNQAALSVKFATGNKNKNSLNIIQINVCGLSNNKTELSNLLDTKCIHVALIQETFHKTTDPHISGYTYYP